MNSKEYKLSLVLILLIASVVLIPLTFSKYLSTYSRQITLNISKPSYQVVFHSNTNPDQTTTQNFVYGTSQQLTANSFTNGSLSFISWNTATDGSGTTYQDGESVNNLTSVNNAVIDLYAQWSGNVAEINGVYYTSIYDAINAVPTNGTLTTINLLVDLSLDINGRIETPSGTNIVLNLGAHTITNDQGVNIPLIDNYGTLRITNGTLTTTAEQGAINNKSTGYLYLDNITITTTIVRTRQCVFNDGGYLEINNGAYLSSMSSARASVQNQAGGTLKVLGGTIIGQNFYGIQNSGNMTIGEKDGVVSRVSPVIQGTYGVYANTAFNFYDGIIKGRTAAVNDMTKLIDIETNFETATSSENISGQTYRTLFLSDDIATIIFNPNGGTVSEASRRVEKGNAIGALPTPENSPKVFDGWYTDPNNGTIISASDIVTGNATYYAHWADGVAEVNGTMYTTLADAISSITNNTMTTITIHANMSGTYTIASNRKITIDLQGHTISNSGNSPVFTNNGHLKLTNGTVTSSGTQGAVNNNANKILEVEDFTISATGTRQAIYNNGGNVTISGNSVLSAVTSERAALHNLAGGTVTVLGGTIKSTGQNAIENVGTLTLGSKDGNIRSASPFVIGVLHGVKNTGTFNFYDGNVNGITSAVNGTVSDMETGAQVVDDTFIYESATYNRKYVTS